MKPAAIGKLMFLNNCEWPSLIFDKVVICRDDCVLSRDDGTLVLRLTDETTVDDVWADYCDAMELILPPL